MEIKTLINCGLSLAPGDTTFSGSGLYIITLGNLLLFQDSITCFLHSPLTEFDIAYLNILHVCPRKVISFD